MAPRYRISPYLVRQDNAGSIDGDPFVQWKSDGQTEIDDGTGRVLVLGCITRQLRSLAWQLLWLADRRDQNDSDVVEVL